MSLIDATIGICVSALFTIACGALILPDGFWAEFRKLVAGEPTIDRPTLSQFKRMAVQLGYEKVVHCKDCRLGDPDLSLKGSEQEVFCNYYDYPKPADGFCEKGKTRTYE